MKWIDGLIIICVLLIFSLGGVIYLDYKASKIAVNGEYDLRTHVGNNPKSFESAVKHTN